jgi:hypothetical protein
MSLRNRQSLLIQMFRLALRSSLIGFFTLIAFSVSIHGLLLSSYQGLRYLDLLSIIKHLQRGYLSDSSLANDPLSNNSLRNSNALYESWVLGEESLAFQFRKVSLMRIVFLNQLVVDKFADRRKIRKGRLQMRYTP